MNVVEVADLSVASAITIMELRKAIMIQIIIDLDFNLSSFEMQSIVDALYKNLMDSCNES